MHIVFGTAGVIIDDQPATAEQIENLLRQLSLARAQMHPPITKTRANQVECIHELDPSMEITRMDESNLHVAFRHTGYGWIAFTLGPLRAIWLRNALVSRVFGEAVDITNDDVAGSKH